MKMEEKTKLTLIYYSVLGIGLIMSGLVAMIVPSLEGKAFGAFLGILGILGVKFFVNDLPNAILEHKILKQTLEREPLESLPTNATTSTIITASPTLKEAVKDLITAITPGEECEPCKDKEDETEEVRFPIFRDPQ